MPRTYKKRRVARFPEGGPGFDVNACVTADCQNFGQPSISSEGQDDRYILAGLGTDSEGPLLGFQCRACKRTGKQYSNLAIAEEKARYMKALTRGLLGSCRTDGCPGNGLDVATSPEQYSKFGYTAIGSPRYRCADCRKTFSVNRSADHRLRHPEKTETIFKLLINKTPMRRLCEVADIGSETLYQRIGRIYDQCQRVARAHERRLLESDLDHQFLHLCTDRQDYTLNWGSALDRTPPTLRSTTTAESRSGYVLAQHLNFDPDIDLQECELEARAIGDPEFPLPFRRFARLNLHPWQTRVDGANRVVPNGIQVHETCSIFAHFFYLAELVGHVPRLQFSLDADPAIDRACLSAFADRVKADKADVVILSINKEMTIDQRRTALSKASEELTKLGEKRPELKKAQLIAAVLADRYQNAVASQPKPFKRWIAHPFPNMNEPEKRALCLSDTGTREAADLGWVLARANLMAIDRYFMQVRRRLSVLERPMATSSQAWRMWRGYNAYSPVVVMKLLEIFRVAYNYHLIGGSKSTPAQRFGLIDKPWSLNDILNFTDD